MPTRHPRNGADHTVMREVNRSIVLDVLKTHSPISRTAIARITTLAKPTVSAIVDDLIAESLVAEVGLGAAASGGGRPPIMLEFNARSSFVAGVQIGVHRTVVVLADARGQEVVRRQIPTSQAPAAVILRRAARELTKALGQAEVNPEALTAVGLVVPGLVDVHTGTCRLAPNLGWRDVAVRETFAAHLPAHVAVFVHNTAQAAAAAEGLEGSGAGQPDVVLLYASTGVGAGVLAGGRIFHGFGGSAGEIGHCRIPGATEPCHCGKIGCLEAVASAPALARAAARAVAEGRSEALARYGAAPTTYDVAEAAAEGDPVAAELIEAVGRHLGLAASWLINLVDPAVLIVGGGLAGIGEALLEPLRSVALAESLFPMVERVQIRPALLGRDAEVRGALLLALQESESSYRVVFQG